MKRFLSVFLAVLAAGLVLFWVWSRHDREVRENERAIAVWSAKAARLTEDLSQRAHADAADILGTYRIARMHLDMAPEGADTRDLQSEVSRARGILNAANAGK